jgi:ferric-dicitrate binding protein FerR (iron transport regulator)
MKRIGVAAACAILLIGLGWYYYTDRIVIATGYAQQQLVTLPDHSTVMLNANSSLSYYRAYGMHRKEVWLKGEGLFDIRHDAADHFTAHAGRLSVEVMGTRFTIRQRRDKIAVALLEGKIGIREGQSAESLILRPGEAVNYEDTLARLSTIVKLPNQPQAWVNHTIQANGMTVQDIIDTYEDTYGYKIILADPSQAAKKIDGSLSLETEEGVLYTLANILNANIHREGKEIYLRPK